VLPTSVLRRIKGSIFNSFLFIYTSAFYFLDYRPDYFIVKGLLSMISCSYGLNILSAYKHDIRFSGLICRIFRII
jgi:hypothetical protein